MKAVVTSGERGPMVRWFAPNFLSNGVAKSPTVINTPEAVLLKGSDHGRRPLWESETLLTIRGCESVITRWGTEAPHGIVCSSVNFSSRRVNTLLCLKSLTNR